MFFFLIEILVQAIVDFNKALNMQPQNCAAHFRRAKAYAALGMHEKAEEDYNRCVWCVVCGVCFFT